MQLVGDPYPHELYRARKHNMEQRDIAEHRFPQFSGVASKELGILCTKRQRGNATPETRGRIPI